MGGNVAVQPCQLVSVQCSTYTTTFIHPRQSTLRIHEFLMELHQLYHMQHFYCKGSGIRGTDGQSRVWKVAVLAAYLEQKKNRVELWPHTQPRVDLSQLASMIHQAKSHDHRGVCSVHGELFHFCCQTVDDGEPTALPPTGMA